MKLLRILLLILYQIYFISNISSQDTIRKIQILPVPAIGYSPETRTYVGAVCLFTLNLYQNDTRTSNAKVEFNYTWNKQIIFETGWNYFFNHEKWFTKGVILYSKYPDLYYGIGTNTPDSNKLVFNSRRLALDLSVLRKVYKQLFSGISFKYINYSKINYSSSNPIYPELISGSTLGIGYTLVNDRRNSILTATKGSYAFFNSTYNFSNKNYLEFNLDLRKYFTWNNKYTLGTRFVNENNFNNPPFFEMNYLGGDKYVRGYYYGRFRDRNLTTVQTEFRFPIYWRISSAVFGGFSNLYPNLNAFNLSNTKYNYGLGLRFLVDKKENTNLRFDYAIGQNGNRGFYIAFGESF